MRFVAAALAVLFLSLPALAQAPPSTAAQPGPDDRAKQWLTLIDDSNFKESAAQMGPQAKPADIASLPALRQPLGAMASRTLKDVKLSPTNPGMRAGQYAVVRYDSRFARRAVAVETVTLAMNKGAWSVVGYRID